MADCMKYMERSMFYCCEGDVVSQQLVSGVFVSVLECLVLLAGRLAKCVCVVVC